jgi:PPOX class probable F420-dependent enzyme
MSMTRAERETFLADRHVAVLAIADPGWGPLAVPVWYAYQPGDAVSVITANDSRKGRLLRAAGRASLCVQTEDFPYLYVSVEGPLVDTEHPSKPEDRVTLARRYLGDELGDAYIDATTAMAPTMTTFRISPERWITEDQSKA